jgi:hypothetical protein
MIEAFPMNYIYYSLCPLLFFHFVRNSFPAALEYRLSLQTDAAVDTAACTALRVSNWAQLNDALVADSDEGNPVRSRIDVI